MPVDQDRPANAGPDRRPWTPPCVPAELLEDPEALSYLVVDEIVGDTVTIAVSGWPGSDELGRVRFDAVAADAPSGHLLVHRKELHERLYEGWLRRTPRVGDAFAAVLGDAVAARLAESGRSSSTTRCGSPTRSPGRSPTSRPRPATSRSWPSTPRSPVSSRTSRPRRSARYRRHRRRPHPAPGAVKPGRWTRPSSPAGTAARWTGRAGPCRRRTGRPAARRIWSPPSAPTPPALFYFLLNIGDGDAQLLLMPEERDPAHPDAPIRASRSSSTPAPRASCARS